MDSKPRRLIAICLLAVLGIGAGLLFKKYEVEFLSWVVKRTVMEKVDSSLDPSAVESFFSRLEAGLQNGSTPRPVYREGLLNTAAYVEKVERLHRSDLEQIYGYFKEIP